MLWQGVCKLPGGFTIFCDRALPGERLRARITAVKKTHAAAVKLDTLREHAHAVVPVCRHFLEGCGGCTMQNLAYSAQLKAKEQQVRLRHSRILTWLAGKCAGLPKTEMVLPIKGI
jgi:methyltransferase-like protein 6